MLEQDQPNINAPNTEIQRMLNKTILNIEFSGQMLQKYIFTVDTYGFMIDLHW